MSEAITAGNASFSSALPGLRLVLSSNSLGQAKQCLRKYYYSTICGWSSRGENQDLVFGSLIHKAREIYDQLRARGDEHEQALGKVFDWALQATWNAELQRPWISDHKLKNRGTLLRSIVWYLDDKGAEDPLETMFDQQGRAMIELPFVFDVGQEASTGEAILFCGKIDRIAKMNDIPYVVDIKTTGQSLGEHFFAKFTPENQFSFYLLAGAIAFGQKIENLIVDAIQIGVGFTRCQRGIVNRPRAVLDEWFAGAKWWLRRLDDCAKDSGGVLREEAWPMNDTACDKYGGCEFREICGRSPIARPGALAGAFIQRRRDPMSEIEEGSF